jgi:hypothetical protein
MSHLEPFPKIVDTKSLFTYTAHKRKGRPEDQRLRVTGDIKFARYILVKNVSII